MPTIANAFGPAAASKSLSRSRKSRFTSFSSSTCSARTQALFDGAGELSVCLVPRSGQAGQQAGKGGLGEGPAHGGSPGDIRPSLPAGARWAVGQQGDLPPSAFLGAQLKPVCGPGDQGEAVVTTMLPEED
jgi:hypothetical protein